LSSRLCDVGLVGGSVGGATVVVRLVVKITGFCVVTGVLTELSGQQTPGTKSRLKQSDSRSCEKSRRRPGQELRSSHLPGRPSGVTQLFSLSFGTESGDWSEIKMGIF
jgi:hypothetical protein